MMQFTFRYSQQKIFIKNGSFWLIKNYAKTVSLIDEKLISKEACYTAQQSLRSMKSAKICIIEKIVFWLIAKKVIFTNEKSKF